MRFFRKGEINIGLAVIITITLLLLIFIIIGVYISGNLSNKFPWI